MEGTRTHLHTHTHTYTHTHSHTHTHTHICVLQALRRQVTVSAKRPSSNLDESLQSVKDILEGIVNHSISTECVIKHRYINEMTCYSPFCFTISDATSSTMGDSMHTIYGAAAALEVDRLQDLAGKKL